MKYFVKVLIIFCFIINSIQITIAQESSFDGSIMLFRPTNTTMTVNITAKTEATVFVEWGAISNNYQYKSTEVTSTNILPAVIVMNNLSPNNTFYYRVNYKYTGKTYSVFRVYF